MTTVNYEAVLDDLETRLRAGQARFDTWAEERDELLAAISSVKAVLARQAAAPQQMDLLPALPRRHPEERPSGADVMSFRGLSYRQATKKVFESYPERAFGAPDVADILFKAGFAKTRRAIKMNVDTIFRRLRETGELQRAGGEDGEYSYTLARTNGAHPSAA